MNNKDGKRNEYDYIIIGSGPAGAVLAKKLTDHKRSSVLVLEAGENNSQEKPIRDSTFAPPTILTDQFLANYFWQGKGVPQERVEGKTFQWTAGRTLGGTTSVNNEQYVRPSQLNMQQWEDLLGPLWSPTRGTAQFVQLEKYNGKTNFPAARGVKGRLNIRQAPVQPTRMVEKFVTAMERATGIPRILDYNDPTTPIGPFTSWQLYQKPDGIRESADTAFLTPDVMTDSGKGVNGRKLTVSFRSTVVKILFNEQKLATGVEYIHAGQCKQAFARRKVIVCAGINSPKILMLSGIGPEKILQKYGIPVIYNNPNVGQHLTTHVITPAFFSANPDDSALPKDDPNAIYPGGAFLPDPSKEKNSKRRAVQIIGMPGEGGGLNIFFYLTEPKSKGTLTIQSADPLKMVLADEGFLKEEADIEAIKRIYRTYIKNIAAELSKIDAHYQLLSPSVETMEDDKKLEEFIKNNVTPTHHVQGTNRMAPSPKTGVVDAVGQVYGVENLIVADDSIAPFVSDGNTSAPAYFIGKNIADQILLWEEMNDEKFGKGNW